MPIFAVILLIVMAMCLLCPVPFIDIVACPICALCFDPNTPVRVLHSSTGKYVKKPISQVRIGDTVEKGGGVTSTLRFFIKNHSADIYNLKDTIVSGSHIVITPDGPKRVKDHPEAKLCVQNPHELICLCTENRRIQVGNQMFCDFYEIRCQQTNALNMHLALLALNNKPLSPLPNYHVPNDHLYDWGCTEDTPILLKDGKKRKPISELEIGDEVSLGGRVYGLIKHSTRDIKMYKLNGMIASGTQAILYKNNWIRLHQHPHSLRVFNFTQPYIYHVVSEHHRLTPNGFTVITDYLELPENHSFFNKLHELNLKSIENEIIKSST